MFVRVVGSPREESGLHRDQHVQLCQVPLSGEVLVVAQVCLPCMKR